MSNHAQRIEVFQDTLAWINSDKDLSDSVDKAKKNTEVFYEDEYPSFKADNTFDTEITVTKDSFQKLLCNV